MDTSNNNEDLNVGCDLQFKPLNIIIVIKLLSFSAEFRIGIASSVITVVMNNDNCVLEGGAGVNSRWLSG